MTRLLLLPALLGILAATAAPADARDRRGEQMEARDQLMAGELMSLRDIEARVIPRMGDARYLGPELDPSARVYRLKFLREGRVIFVDVDGRTGRILSQRG